MIISTIFSMRAGADPFYISLGQQIQQLRKQRGLTQEQLGVRLVPQVTRASIANIESGKQRLLAHTLAQIAEALEVKVNELIRERSVPLDEEGKQQLEAELQVRLAGKKLPRESLESLSRKLGLGEPGEEGSEDATTSENRGGAQGGGDAD